MGPNGAPPVIQRARVCPGCGGALDRQYECRHGALVTYCFTCATNWYVRDVGYRTIAGEAVIQAEMLPLPADRQVRTRA